MTIRSYIKTTILSVLCILMCGMAVVFADGGEYISVDGNSLPVYTLQKSGNDNESFVILLLGDGYTEAEQDVFLENMANRGRALLNTEPFRSYSDKINIYIVPTVSAESGISVDGGKKVDTYFNLSHYYKVTSFTGNGEQKARAIRAELERSYLDKGAVVGTIHILANTTETLGISTGPLFSFSSMSSNNSTGCEAFIHEIAHSIGRLKDEYGALSDGVNTWGSTDSESVPWKKLLGFRGVGMAINAEYGNDVNGRVPSVSCNMLTEFAGSFCEVCKLELAKRLNSYSYTQAPDKYYVANPDITIEHSEFAVGEEYEKSRINNGVLKRAENHTLELRTVVQNFTNKTHRLKLSLRVLDENKANKYVAEKEFEIPPLPDDAYYEFEYEPAKKSLSVKIDKLGTILFKDTVVGEVIDCETGEVVASNKTETEVKRRVNINHKIKAEDGTLKDMPGAYQTTVYVPDGIAYSPRKMWQLNGYIYEGNSLENGEDTVINADTDIVFYYHEPKPVTETVISEDKKSFEIKAVDVKLGSVIILALYDNDRLCDLKTEAYSGEILKYTTDKYYTSAKTMVWRDLDKMTPITKEEEIRVYR